MADLRKTYATDIEKEQDGVWSDDLGDGLKLKIARLKNPQFRKMYQRLTKPYERQIRNRTLSDDIENKILSQCLAKTVLLDWQNLVLDGATLPYSYENSLKVLGDPGLADFRDMVVDLANDADLFRDEDIEDAEKNLTPGSSGTSNGENTSSSSNE